MAVADYERPKCTACEFVKCHRQLDKTNTIKKNFTKEKYLNKDHLLPVNMVYADHCILWSLGGLYHKNDKSDPYDMFSGRCVFVEHASGSIKCQVAILAT